MLVSLSLSEPNYRVLAVTTGGNQDWIFTINKSCDDDFIIYTSSAVALGGYYGKGTKLKSFKHIGSISGTLNLLTDIYFFNKNGKILGSNDPSKIYEVKFNF